MSRIEVEGMHRLSGEISIQGSKNSVLPILSACVLNEGETVLHGCPKIKDVFSMLEALECAGAKIKWEGNSLYLDTSVMRSEPFVEKAGSMRFRWNETNPTRDNFFKSVLSMFLLLSNKN